MAENWELDPKGAAPAPPKATGADVTELAPAAGPSKPGVDIGGALKETSGMFGGLGSLILPTSATDVGFLAASLAGGPLVRVAPYLTKVPAPIRNIVLGAIGAEAGNLLSGGTMGRGAALGAIGAAGGEALTGAAGGVVPRMAEKVGLIGPAKERVAARAAATGAAAKAAASATQSAKIGELAGKIAPPLKATTAEELSTLGMYHQDTRTALGEAMAQGIEKAQQLIGGPQVKIRDPFRAGPNLSADEERMIRRQLGLGARDPIPWGKTTPAEVQLAKELSTPITNPTEWVTVEEATRKLADLGHGIWRGREGTAIKLPQRAAAGQYTEARKDIYEQLKGFNTGAEVPWDQGRYAFSAGNALVSVLKKDKVFERLPEHVNLDPRGLQQVVARHAQSLKQRLSADDWATLQGHVWPNRRPATRAAKGPPLPSAPAVFTYGQLGQLYLNSAMQRAMGAMYPDT